MSKYAQLASKDTLPDKLWDRSGLSEEEWAALTTEERVIHYNRQNFCEHKANLFDWPPDLRGPYSFDPYFHVAHMDKCQRPKLSIDKCPCQMCVQKIGIERGGGNSPKNANNGATDRLVKVGIRKEIR